MHYLADWIHHCPAVATSGYMQVMPLSEADIRRIVREELERAKQVG
jgi:hypothetical protein